MNKRILNMALMSLLAVAMPVSITSCKDYDDDITTINGTTDGLSAQIKQLEEAIQANKAAAQAAATAAEAARQAAADAKKAGDDAMAAAMAAQGMAKDAEAAAAKAKADALAQIAAEVTKLNAAIAGNDAAIKANANQIAALVSRIEGVEKGLAAIDLNALQVQIDEVKKYSQAIETQKAALEAFEQTLNTKYTELKGLIDGLGDKITAAQTEIGNIKTTIGTIQSKLEANSADIATIKADLGKVSSQISDAVGSAISTLSGVLAERLTSITLIPDLYIGGIPAVSFSSVKYIPQVQNKNTHEWINDGINNLVVSNGQTVFTYRMNPSNVTAKGIDFANAAFIGATADSRALIQKPEEQPLKIVETPTISNGVLTVKAAKNNAASLNAPAGKINTVSLMLPIAKEFWFEGETSPAVYSEFVRLEETYSAPSIHKTAAVNSTINNHFNTYSQIYGSTEKQLVSAQVQYNETLDLSSLVQVCLTNAGVDKALKADELALYPLALSYSIAREEYTPTADKTNQQAYGKISGSTFTPIVPNGTEQGIEKNQACIGKEPIVLVTLTDTDNNKTVCATYLKLQIVREKVDPIVETVHEPFALDLGCGTLTADVKWSDMAAKLLSKFNNGNGISEKDFASIYGNASKITITPNCGTVVPTLNSGDVATPVLSYSVGAGELPAILPGESLTIKVSVEYTDDDEVYPACTANFDVVITNNILFPVFNSNNLGVQWYGSNAIDITPIPYGAPNAGTTADYNTSILLGRPAPYVSGGSSCAMFAMYLPSTTGNTSLTLDGHAQSTQSNVTWWKNAAYINGLTSYDFVIANDANGIKAVENQQSVTVNVDAKLNGEISGTIQNIGKMTLNIKKPLKMDVATDHGSFTDNSVKQSINIANSFTLRDWAGNLVAKEDVADGTEPTTLSGQLYKYYGITNVTFAGTDIKICSDANGKDAVTPASLNMSAEFNVASGELVFQNAGALIKKTAYIQVPVAVTHKWGVLKGNLYIPIKPYAGN